MEQRKGFLKAFFIVIICSGIAGLIEYFFFAGKGDLTAAGPILWNVLTSIIGIGVFVLSIIAIVIFAKDKFPKITLVMPITELGVGLIVFLYGFIVGLRVGLSGGTDADIIFHPFIFTFALIFSFFEVVFASFMLTKFK